MIHICKHHLETDHVHPFYIANCQKHQRLRGFSIDSYEVSRPATHSTSLLRPWKWALNVTTTLSENVGKNPWAIAIRLIIIIPLKWPILEVYPPDTSIYWWIVVISCNILTLSIQNPKQKWFYHSRISLTFSGLLTANHGLHSCLIHRSFQFTEGINWWHSVAFIPSQAHQLHSFHLNSSQRKECIHDWKIGRNTDIYRLHQQFSTFFMLHLAIGIKDYQRNFLQTRVPRVRRTGNIGKGCRLCWNARNLVFLQCLLQFIQPGVSS